MQRASCSPRACMSYCASARVGDALCANEMRGETTSACLTRLPALLLLLCVLSSVCSCFQSSDFASSIMSAKAIREFDGKLMLSKYLNANSCQTHATSPHCSSKRGKQRQRKSRSKHLTPLLLCHCL